MADDAQKSRKGYHHGNLREALIEAARGMIAERGPHGFTFAEIARAAGVSPAAPYRHFKSLNDLLVAVAHRGFELFGDLLERAYDGGRPSALSSFEAVGRAYLSFARNEPGYYIAMFESGLSDLGDPAFRAAADRALGVLNTAAERLLERVPEDQRPPARMVANHVWAMAHGVVELFARGEPSKRSPMSADDLLESGVGIYLHGLGVLGGD